MADPPATTPVGGLTLGPLQPAPVAQPPPPAQAPSTAPTPTPATPRPPPDYGAAVTLINQGSPYFTPNVPVGGQVKGAATTYSYAGNKYHFEQGTDLLSGKIAEEVAAGRLQVVSSTPREVQPASPDKVNQIVIRTPDQFINTYGGGGGGAGPLLDPRSNIYLGRQATIGVSGGAAKSYAANLASDPNSSAYKSTVQSLQGMARGLNVYNYWESLGKPPIYDPGYDLAAQKAAFPGGMTTFEFEKQLANPDNPGGNRPIPQDVKGLTDFVLPGLQRGLQASFDTGGPGKQGLTVEEYGQQLKGFYSGQGGGTGAGNFPRGPPPAPVVPPAPDVSLIQRAPVATLSNNPAENPENPANVFSGILSPPLIIVPPFMNQRPDTPPVPPRIPGQAFMTRDAITEAALGNRLGVGGPVAPGWANTEEKMAAINQQLAKGGSMVIPLAGSAPDLTQPPPDISKVAIPVMGYTGPDILLSGKPESLSNLGILLDLLGGSSFKYERAFTPGANGQPGQYTVTTTESPFIKGTIIANSGGAPNLKAYVMGALAPEYTSPLAKGEFYAGITPSGFSKVGNAVISAGDVLISTPLIGAFGRGGYAQGLSEGLNSMFVAPIGYAIAGVDVVTQRPVAFVKSIPGTIAANPLPYAGMILLGAGGLGVKYATGLGVSTFIPGIASEVLTKGPAYAAGEVTGMVAPFAAISGLRGGKGVNAPMVDVRVSYPGNPDAPLFEMKGNLGGMGVVPLLRTLPSRILGRVWGPVTSFQEGGQLSIPDTADVVTGATATVGGPDLLQRAQFEKVQKIDVGLGKTAEGIPLNPEDVALGRTITAKVTNEGRVLLPLDRPTVEGIQSVSPTEAVLDIKEGYLRIAPDVSPDLVAKLGAKPVYDVTKETVPMVEGTKELPTIVVAPPPKGLLYHGSADWRPGGELPVYLAFSREWAAEFAKMGPKGGEGSVIKEFQLKPGAVGIDISELPKAGIDISKYGPQRMRTIGYPLDFLSTKPGYLDLMSDIRNKGIDVLFDKNDVRQLLVTNPDVLIEYTDKPQVSTKYPTVRPESISETLTREGLGQPPENVKLAQTKTLLEYRAPLSAMDKLLGEKIKPGQVEARATLLEVDLGEALAQGKMGDILSSPSIKLIGASVKPVAQTIGDVRSPVVGAETLEPTQPAAVSRVRALVNRIKPTAQGVAPAEGSTKYLVSSDFEKMAKVLPSTTGSTEYLSVPIPEVIPQKFQMPMGAEAINPVVTVRPGFDPLQIARDIMAKRAGKPEVLGIDFPRQVKIPGPGDRLGTIDYVEAARQEEARGLRAMMAGDRSYDISKGFPGTPIYAEGEVRPGAGKGNVGSSGSGAPLGPTLSDIYGNSQGSQTVGEALQNVKFPDMTIRPRRYAYVEGEGETVSGLGRQTEIGQRLELMNEAKEPGGFKLYLEPKAGGPSILAPWSGLLGAIGVAGGKSGPGMTETGTLTSQEINKIIERTMGQLQTEQERPVTGMTFQVPGQKSREDTGVRIGGLERQGNILLVGNRQDLGVGQGVGQGMRQVPKVDQAVTQITKQEVVLKLKDDFVPPPPKPDTPPPPPGPKTPLLPLKLPSGYGPAGKAGGLRYSPSIKHNPLASATQVLGRIEPMGPWRKGRKR